MIKRTLISNASINMYYRYTCEKCGCRSQWISHMINGSAQSGINAFNEKNISSVASELSEQAKQKLEGLIKRYEDEIRYLLDGHQCSNENRAIDGVFNEYDVCPKCGHSQSWWPKKTLFKKGAEKYNAKTPIVSEPDFAFGSERPEEEADLDEPCTFVIDINSTGHTLKTDYLLLNDEPSGEISNGKSLTVQTKFKDNAFAVVSYPGGPRLITHYFEAESGAEVRLRFTGRKFEQVK